MPDDRVADDDRPVALEGRRAGRLERLGEDARGQRPDGGRERPGEVVPGEHARPPAGREPLGQGRLLDGQERARPRCRTGR